MMETVIGALDIGGTKIAAAMVTPQGGILNPVECQTAPDKGVAYGLAQIQSLLHDSHQNSGGRLVGIGIGCTGPVFPLTGALGPNNFLHGWEGFNLVEAVENRFHVPTAMENDADAAALAEYNWGAGKGASRFIYLTVSTGIGSGIILDGRLYRGVDGSHPEAGHQVIDPSGPLCTCGACGCWESLASGPALAAWMKEHSPGGTLPDDLDARQVCALAEGGHPLALQAVTHEADYLGIGLANLVSLFCPDVIALGGGVMKSWHLFSGRVQEIISHNCRLVPAEKARLVPAAFGASAGLAGAAQVWLHRFGQIAVQ